jgi:hypothetical protein
LELVDRPDGRKDGHCRIIAGQYGVHDIMVYDPCGNRFDEKCDVTEDRLWSPTRADLFKRKYIQESNARRSIGPAFPWEGTATAGAS